MTTSCSLIPRPWKQGLVPIHESLVQWPLLRVWSFSDQEYKILTYVCVCVRYRSGIRVVTSIYLLNLELHEEHWNQEDAIRSSS